MLNRWLLIIDHWLLDIRQCHSERSEESVTAENNFPQNCAAIFLCKSCPLQSCRSLPGIES